VDAAQALADLTEISSQIEAAVLFDAGDTVAGSTLADAAAAEALARAAGALLDAASAFGGDATVTQVEASTGDGSVFVVRDGDRRIAATTGPSPTVGLVFYDLKTCLRDTALEPGGAEPEKPKRPRRRKADDAA
jgi:hypothetical protein